MFVSEKTCGRCGKTKATSCFQRRGKSFQSWCRDCRREYDASYHRRTRVVRLEQKREWYARLNDWYRGLKENLPCADCGGRFHHAAMEWDHLPGAEKLADVSALLGRRNRTVILAEIAKCELVCANCHAVRTFTRRRGVAQPG